MGLGRTCCSAKRGYVSRQQKEIGLGKRKGLSCSKQDIRASSHCIRGCMREGGNDRHRTRHEPWKAPIADQKKWGCLIRGDGGYSQGEDAMAGDLPQEESKKVYPKPMFDFAARRDICMQGMKTAYAVKLYGADKDVLEGTWRKHFDDAAEGPTEGKSGPPGAMFEEDDGTGELDAHERVEDHKSPQKARKHKREDSGKQGRLDGHFDKKSKT